MLTLSSQGLVTGSFSPGTFTAGFAFNAGTSTYYSSTAILTAAGTIFDPATLMPSSGGSVSITGPVAVTGTFWQTTQPVSGTFWQSIQPISGTVGISGTVPVSIASSVPVTVSSSVPLSISGTVPVSIASSVPVTGTFWQATQPISAASLPLPAGASTSALQSATNTALGALALESGGNLATVATAQGVGGTGLTLPVGGSGVLGWLSGCYSTLQSILSAALGSIPAGTALIGKVGIDQTTPGTTNAVSVTNLPTVTPASTNSIAANTAIAAHISAVAGQYGYVSTVTISGLGATAASAITCTITGCIGGTYTFYINVPALPLALQPVQVFFNPPKQSSAVNTQIQVNVPAFGSGNTNASVMMDGYTSTSASPLP